MLAKKAYFYYNRVVLNILRNRVYHALRQSEHFFETDMVYLIKGGSWLFFGHIISAASSFLLVIAFANLIPKETFGTYKYILSLTGILLIPSLPGMNTAINMASARNFDGTLLLALKTRMRWGLLSSLMSLLVSGYYFLNGNTILTISFLIASVFLPFIDAFGIYGPFLYGKKKFQISTKYEAISQVLSTGVLVLVIYQTSNLFLIVLSYFLTWTLLRFTFFNITAKKFALTKDEDLEAITYGKHLSLIRIVNTIASYIDRLFVFHFLGAISLAVYSFSIAIPEQIKGVFSLLDTLAFPKFVGRDPREIRSSFIKKALKLFLLGAVVIGAYILVAPFIFKTFFPQYQEAVFYSQLFALSMLNLALFPATTVLKAKKKIGELYISNFITPVFQIIIMLVFIVWKGLLGLIIARIISRFFGSLLDTYLFYRTPLDNNEESPLPAPPK